MPTYRLVWLELAKQQYLDLSAELREVIDARLAQVLEDPTAQAAGVYNKQWDQWSVALADRGLLLYAVVRDPATVIVLRVIIVA